MYSLALIIFVVSEKKAFEHFPIGSNVNLCPAVAAILDFRSTLDPMGKMFQNASLKPLGQLKPNCTGMIIGRSSTKCLLGFNVNVCIAVAAILDFRSAYKTDII
jgi:hypothetical protein